MGIIAALLIIFLRYRKITYEIRHIRSGGTVVQMDKAIQIDTPYGKLWKTLKTKREVYIPQSDAIDMNNKGRIHVIALWYENGEVDYLKITNASFEPTKTEAAMRMVHIKETKKATDRGISFMDKFGAQMFYFGAIIMLFVIIFVFWNDIHEPMLNLASSLSSAAESFKEAAMIIKEGQGEQVFN